MGREDDNEKEYFSQMIKGFLYSCDYIFNGYTIKSYNDGEREIEADRALLIFYSSNRNEVDVESFHIQKNRSVFVLKSCSD